MKRFSLEIAAAALIGVTGCKRPPEVRKANLLEEASLIATSVRDKTIPLKCWEGDNSLFCDKAKTISELKLTHDRERNELILDRRDVSSITLKQFIDGDRCSLEQGSEFFEYSEVECGSLRDAAMTALGLGENGDKLNSKETPSQTKESTPNE